MAAGAAEHQIKPVNLSEGDATLNVRFLVLWELFPTKVEIAMPVQIKLQEVAIKQEEGHDPLPVCDISCSKQEVLMP